MRNLTVIIIAFCFVFFLGCYKKTDCPGFPANLNYFPYTLGQYLDFVNSLQDTSTFIIFEKVKTVDYTVYFSRPGFKPPCNTTMHFHMASNKEKKEISGGFLIDGGGPGIINFAEIVILFEKDIFKKVIIEDVKISYNEIENYLTDTLSIENMVNKTVKKVVIVKGEGIVSYTTADGEEWKLLDVN